MSIPSSLTPQRGAPRPPLGTPPASLVERARHGSSSSSQQLEARSPATTIAVLPSSLPDYHKAYMKGHPPPSQDPITDKIPADTPRSHEEQLATARALKPHSKSQLNLQQAHQKPESMTPIPSKRSKPTKWQFGIRSRNQPTEAMLAIYRALVSMGADWEIPNIRRPGGRRHGESTPGSRSRSGSEYDSDDSESDADPGDVDPQHTRSRRSIGLEVKGSRSGMRPRADGLHNDWGYEVPEDPWVINARFRKDQMFPPGLINPGSSHSSRVDLMEGNASAAAEMVRRRGSLVPTSSGNSTTSLDKADGSKHATNAPGSADVSVTGASPENDRQAAHDNIPEPDESVYVYLTIQLYSIEKDFFLVDFKCAGYERLIKELVREIKTEVGEDPEEEVADLHAQEHQEYSHSPEDDRGRLLYKEKSTVWKRLDDLGKKDFGDWDEKRGEVRERTDEIPAGRYYKEKVATSPFPFLDVAGNLIIQLAEGN